MTGVIPAVRREMEAVLAGPELMPAEYRRRIAEWLPRLKRRPARRRGNAGGGLRGAEREAARLKCLHMALLHPTMTYQEIAYAAGIKNIGRVSEWLSGTPTRDGLL